MLLADDGEEEMTRVPKILSSSANSVAERIRSTNELPSALVPVV